MLNISFNMGDLTPGEAKALVVMLSTAFPEAGLPSRYTAKAVDVLVQSSAEKPVWATGDVEIVDEASIDAAAAFSTTPGTVEDAAAAFANAPTPVREGELDSAGIPWDERIHASTKTRTANGQWTRRRNTPDATYDTVMAELKGSAPAIPPPPSVPAPPTATSVPSPTPAAPAASSIDPASPTAFPEIMKKVTAAQAAGKIDPAGIGNLLKSLGLEPSIISLNKDKAMIPAFEALLADHVGMQS